MKIIQKIKDTPIGVRLQVIGYIVAFTCWIIPVVVTDALSIEGDLGLTLMLIQMGVGGFLILLGAAVKKREDEDPYYTVPKNFFRVFKAWQLLLMIAVVLFFSMVLCNLHKENSWISNILLCAMYGCLIAAAVVGIVQHKKNKKNYVSVGNGKMIRAGGPVVSSVRCNGCSKLLNPNDLRTFERKSYCSSCYMKVQAKKQREEAEKNAKIMQSHCSVCGRVFPQSSFHLVNDKLICDDCFRKEYAVDLQ